MCARFVIAHRSVERLFWRDWLNLAESEPRAIYLGPTATELRSTGSAQVVPKQAITPP
jgi:hypothetical protein